MEGKKCKSSDPTKIWPFMVSRKYSPKDIVKTDIHVIAWLYNVRCTCTCMYAYQVLYMYMTSHMYS
jgi:hypothetical protein